LSAYNFVRIVTRQDGNPWIVLVETASASVADLNFAVSFANHYIATHSPAQTAEMILPYGNFESAGEIANDAFFTAPGVIYISGNQFGLDLEYPAASTNVIGIGITGFARDSDGQFQYEFASEIRYRRHQSLRTPPRLPGFRICRYLHTPSD